MEPLVERERELDAVARVVRERGVLVIEGGAGLGKTSLLQAACRQAAARGDRVVRAGGSELESGFAFGVVRQLFERAVAEAGPARRRRRCWGAATSRRAQLRATPSSPSSTGCTG